MPSWLVIVVRSVQIGLFSFTAIDLGFCGDLVARPHRCPEVPIDVQEHAARTRKILGDERVEEPRGHAALHDDPSEAAPKRSFFVVVERVVVARQLGEQLDVAPRDPSGPSRRLANLHVGQAVIRPLRWLPPGRRSRSASIFESWRAVFEIYPCAIGGEADDRSTSECPDNDRAHALLQLFRWVRRLQHSRRMYEPVLTAAGMGTLADGEETKWMSTS